MLIAELALSGSVPLAGLKRDRQNITALLGSALEHFIRQLDIEISELEAEEAKLKDGKKKPTVNEILVMALEQDNFTGQHSRIVNMLNFIDLSGWKFICHLDAEFKLLSCSAQLRQADQSVSFGVWCRDADISNLRANERPPEVQTPVYSTYLGYSHTKPGSNVESVIWSIAENVFRDGRTVAGA